MAVNRNLVREYAARLNDARNPRGGFGYRPAEAWHKTLADIKADARLSKSDLHLIARQTHVMRGSGLQFENYTKSMVAAFDLSPGWAKSGRDAAPKFAALRQAGTSARLGGGVMAAKASAGAGSGRSG